MDLHFSMPLSVSVRQNVRVLLHPLLYFSLVCKPRTLVLAEGLPTLCMVFGIKGNYQASADTAVWKQESSSHD